MSYASARLIGLIAVIGVAVGLGWMAASSWEDHEVGAMWAIYAGMLAFIGWLFVMALVATCRAVWWLDLNDDGIRVRRLLSSRRYDVSQIVDARMATLTMRIPWLIVSMWVTILITLLVKPLKLPFDSSVIRHNTLTLTVATDGARKDITVCLNRRETDILEQIDHLQVAPGRSVPLQPLHP